jgi:hypothetical protein
MLDEDHEIRNGPRPLVKLASSLVESARKTVESPTTARGTSPGWTDGVVKSSTTQPSTNTTLATRTRRRRCARPDDARGRAERDLSGEKTVRKSKVPLKFW